MKKQTIFILIGLLVIILVIILATHKAPVQTPVANTPAVTTPVVQTPTVITVVYDSKTAFTPTVTQVKEGDTATLRVTSDVADELHFHGYDLHTDLTAGVPGEITFTATKTGRFEFELESTSTTLGYVEVYPK